MPRVARWAIFCTYSRAVSLSVSFLGADRGTLTRPVCALQSPANIPPPPPRPLQRLPLLSGQRVFVHEPIDKLEVGQFRGLLEAAGATLVEDALARADQHVITLASAARLSAAGAADLERSYPGNVLDQTWLLDTISFYAARPMREYCVSVLVSAKVRKP